MGYLPAPGPDGRIWLTTKQAAEEMHVAPCTITAWRHKGYLTPHPASPPRHPLYCMDGLIKAEQCAREAALRTSGTLKRVRRRVPAHACGWDGDQHTSVTHSPVNREPFRSLVSERTNLDRPRS